MRWSSAWPRPCGNIWTPSGAARREKQSDPGHRHGSVRHRQPAAYLAKRFAAKEAFSKALGTGIHFPVNWHNVWVENARSGKPSLKFSKALAARLKRRGIADVHVSLTDEIGTACAFVVVEGAAPKARRKR